MSTTPAEMAEAKAAFRRALDGCAWIPKSYLIDLYRGLEKIDGLTLHATEMGEEATRRWLAGGQP